MPRYVTRDMMTLKKFAVQWKGHFQNCVFTIDKYTIGTFDNEEELIKGREFVLSDGGKVHVSLKKKGLFSIIKFTVNDRELYGFGRVARFLSEFFTFT